MNVDFLPKQTNKLVNELLSFYSTPNKFEISNSPRLFVVHKDGTGLELIREKEISTYFNLQTKKSNVDISQENRNGFVCINVFEKTFDKPSNIVYRQVLNLILAFKICKC